MLMKKSIIIPLSLTIMSVNSEMVMAVEKTSSSSSFAGWPLIALVVLLVVFRKQLFAEATVDQPDTDNQDVAVAAKKVTEAKVEPEVSTTKATPAPAPKPVPTPKPAPAPQAKVEPKVAPKTENKSNIIDITGDGKQCQGSTAKGTRCKRTTTLTTTTLKVADKTYKLTVCTQHNNDKLKPFSELLK